MHACTISICHQPNHLFSLHPASCNGHGQFWLTIGCMRTWAWSNGPDQHEFAKLSTAATTVVSPHRCCTLVVGGDELKPAGRFPKVRCLRFRRTYRPPPATRFDETCWDRPCCYYTDQKTNGSRCCTPLIRSVADPADAGSRVESYTVEPTYKVLELHEPLGRDDSDSERNGALIDRQIKVNNSCRASNFNSDRDSDRRAKLVRLRWSGAFSLTAAFLRQM
jgi:hypothetical protein